MLLAHLADASAAAVGAAVGGASLLAVAAVAVSVPALIAEGLLTGALGAAAATVIVNRRNRVRLEEAASAASTAQQTTARSDAELRSRAQEVATIAGAARALPMGIVVVGASGSELMCNDEAALVLGPAEGKGEHRSDGEVMAGGTLRRLLERGASGQRGRETLEIVGPPRRSFVVLAEPIGEPVNGQFAVVGTVTDVSEQRRTDAMRQDFITNVSHELRTPVGAVAVLAETLSQEDDPAIVARLTARLESEAHRLSAMVDDLLALGTVESGGAGDDLLPVPELLDEAIERARVSAETRRVPIVIEDVGRGLAVHGDRRQLVTAMHNLLENALKYSDKDAPVRVRASARRDGATNATRIAIDVVDQGIGIPSRDQERIFERFYRVDRARARDTGGSGLGLAIVRHVMLNHNGEVSVRSIEGEGSTFTLLIPGVALDTRDSPSFRVPDTMPVAPDDRHERV